MTLFSGKLSILIPVGMFLAVMALWQLSHARLILMMLLLLYSILRALASVIAKHRAARLQGRITSVVFVRNVLIEIMFLLLVMILAGFLAQHIVQFATQQIGNDFIRFAAGIATGLLVGICVGAVLHPLWGRLITTSAES